MHYFSIWGFAREYVWQSIWDKLLDTVGEDPFNLMFYGTFCLTSIVYWTVNTLPSQNWGMISLLNSWG